MRPGRTQASAKCAARDAHSAAADPRDPKAHGGAPRSVPSPPTPPPAAPTIVQIEPRTCPSAVINGGEHGGVGPVGTSGCRLDSGRRAVRRGPARPNRAPHRTPSARDGIASSTRMRSKPALGRGYSIAPARRSPSGRAVGEQCSIGPPGAQPGQSPTTHHGGVASHVSCVRARVCPSPCPDRSLLLTGGSGRARGTPSYLVGFARC